MAEVSRCRTAGVCLAELTMTAVRALGEGAAGDCSRPCSIFSRRLGLVRTESPNADINLGGKEVVALHFAPCHTNGDTFAYFLPPQGRVVGPGFGGKKSCKHESLYPYCRCC